MNLKQIVFAALLAHMGLAASAMASGRRPEAKDDWKITAGTVTSVSVQESKIMIQGKTGGVESYTVNEANSLVERPAAVRKQHLTDVLVGDHVTLYVDPRSNVVGRIIYSTPASDASAASNSVATATSAAAGTIATATATVVNNIVVATSTVSNATSTVSNAANDAGTALTSAAAGTPVVGVVVSNSNNQLTVLRGDGGTSRFTINSPVLVEGRSGTTSSLPLNTKVKVWSDASGNVKRVSTQSSDVNF